MRRLLIATTNRGKQAEYRRLLAGLDTELVTPDEIGLDLDVEEPWPTYAENASAKADAYARVSNLLCLADDSGIEIAVLDWGPGVRSARWAQGRHAERVLAAVAGADDRRARMVCALAVAEPGDGGPSIEVFHGVIEGTIAHEPRGEGGFGYDPIFLLPEGVTTAELPEEAKDRLSHRGRAVRAAHARLAHLVGDPVS